jgi:hypothetical protein
MKRHEAQEIEQAEGVWRDRQWLISISGSPIWSIRQIKMGKDRSNLI